MKNVKSNQRKRRHSRIRVKISGTITRPRLAIFKSNRHINAQLINDEKGVTIASVSDIHIKKGKDLTKNVNIEEAEMVGKEIAAKALNLKIEDVVFDRGGFKYHGLIKAVAEGARKGGLKF